MKYIQQNEHIKQIYVVVNTSMKSSISFPYGTANQPKNKPTNQPKKKILSFYVYFMLK